MSSHERSAQEHGGFSYQQHPAYNGGASSSNSPNLHPLLNGSGADHGGAHHQMNFQHHQKQQQQHAEVPTVALGRTRCYWCILSPTLDFVFVDPILHTHLEEQSKAFIGSNLLDYVHPDERQSLGEDLMPKVGDAGGIEGSGVFGSITRCRYSRLPHIRKLLGCKSPPEDPDARLIVEDDEYLQIRITTSWIGGGEAGSPGAGNLNGAVLAFFHATEDKDEAQDNDENKRSSWSNWCGPRLEDGSYLGAYRCAQLVDALQRATASNSPASAPGDPPPHVFQILDHTGRAIVSFPSSGYDEEEYAALAREVLRKPRHEAEDTTSCTRRYRSKHPVMKDSALITVESVVIKYGAVTFACFETGGIYFNSTQQKPADKFKLEDVPATFDSSAGNKRQSDSFGNDSYSAKRARTQGEDEKPLSIATNPRHYAPKLSDSDRTNGGGISPTVASASAILGSFSHQQDAYQHHQPPFHPLQHTSHPQHHPGVYSNMYPPHPMQHQPSHHAPPSFAYPPHPLAPQNHQPPPHPLSQQHSFAPPPPYGASAHLEHMAHATATSSTSPVEQLPRLPELLPPTSAPPPPQAPYGSAPAASPKEPKSGKVKGEPKNKPGPKACESCGTANSPEWRKGPDGTKSLCNACGLRFARAVARKAKLAEMEANGGVAPPKKAKKGKGAAAKQATAASSAPASEPIPSSGADHHHQASHHQHPSPPLPQHHHHAQIYELPPTSSAPQQPPPPRPYSPYFTTAPQAQGHYSPVPSSNPSTYHHLPQINTNPGRYEGQRSASGGSHHNSPFGSPHPHSHEFQQQQQHNGGEEELPRRSSAGGSAGFIPPPPTSLGGSNGHVGWAPAPLPPSSQPGGYQPYGGWAQHERTDSGGGGYGN